MKKRLCWFISCLLLLMLMPTFVYARGYRGEYEVFENGECLSFFVAAEDSAYAASVKTTFCDDGDAGALLLPNGSLQLVYGDNGTTLTSQELQALLTQGMDENAEQASEYFANGLLPDLMTLTGLWPDALKLVESFVQYQQIDDGWIITIDGQKALPAVGERLKQNAENEETIRTLASLNVWNAFMPEATNRDELIRQAIQLLSDSCGSTTFDLVVTLTYRLSGTTSSYDLDWREPYTHITANVTAGDALSFFTMTCSHLRPDGSTDSQAMYSGNWTRSSDGKLNTLSCKGSFVIGNDEALLTLDITRDAVQQKQWNTALCFGPTTGESAGEYIRVDGFLRLLDNDTLDRCEQIGSAKIMGSAQPEQVFSAVLDSHGLNFHMDFMREKVDLVAAWSPNGYSATLDYDDVRLMTLDGSIHIDDGLWHDVALSYLSRANRNMVIRVHQTAFPIREPEYSGYDHRIFVSYMPYSGHERNIEWHDRQLFFEDKGAIPYERFDMSKRTELPYTTFFEEITKEISSNGFLGLR